MQCSHTAAKTQLNRATTHHQSGGSINFIKNLNFPLIDSSRRWKTNYVFSNKKNVKINLRAQNASALPSFSPVRGKTHNYLLRVRFV